jgi:hypothetical protein
VGRILPFTGASRRPLNAPAMIRIDRSLGPVGFQISA